MALNPFYRQNAWDIFEDPLFHHGLFKFFDLNQYY